MTRGRLVAVIDPRPAEGSPAELAGIAWYADLDTFLAAGIAVDVALPGAHRYPRTHR